VTVAASPTAAVADAPEVDADAGLSSLEAEHRLLTSGPNELVERGGTPWPRALARQLTHPLALLLWGAAALAFVSGSTVVAIAVFIVIALNAALAFA
jgi:magnesium-transporting ATPase (P-type)